MKHVAHAIILLATILLCSCDNDKQVIDIAVIGGGASGVPAGVQSARMGMKTILIEETEWLGGMLTGAGVSATDGNHNLPAGMWGEFRDSLSNYYSGLDSLRTGWVSNTLFEPSVGNKILNNITQKEKNLTVLTRTTIKNIIRNDEYWQIEIEDSAHKKQVIKAKIVIDATELGDVAKLCGASYDIGMESKEVTGEDIAPQQANHIIQDLTYVAVLKDYKKEITIEKPEGYNPDLFACACDNPLCISPKEPDRVWSKDKMITYGKLPQNKYMINWPIEGNDYYVNIIEMTPQDRQITLQKAKDHTLCFVYFIQHELGYNTFGLADDEFPTKDKLPLIPYYRESRRIHGLVRFTLNHITKPYEQKDKLYRTCIAVGDYPVDHHHNQYKGDEELPNLYFYPIPSYGLPLGTLIPKDVEELIVAEKSISVSNIVNGTTRLQPVVMQIGQAAGILATLAIKSDIRIKDVSVRAVQEQMLNAKGYLLPYLDVPVNDPIFQPLQRIGSTGIMRGVGKNVGWSNQTWFRKDSPLLFSELAGITEIYPSIEKRSFTKEQPMTIKESINLIEQIREKEHSPIIEITNEQVKEVWQKYKLTDFNIERAILRGEMAVLIDRFLDPFHTKEIDITGAYIKK
ncbi:hypothetical protein EZS27_000892 [termite gut metagenome]|uniref:FAD-dependent oxidoreductase n=1 Tax=termite gut metagenome TaxID=433724 RepID=A0A5J4T0H8_9ZZZZ